MSFYFDISQYPTKAVDELCDRFLEKTLHAWLEQALFEAKSLQDELAVLPTYLNQEVRITALGTFDGPTYRTDSIHHPERYREYTGNERKQRAVTQRIERLEALKNVLEKTEQVMQKAATERLRKRALTKLVEAMKSLYDEGCDGYSESASGSDFLVLKRLFKRTTGISLSRARLVTTAAWRTLFQSLTKELLAEELMGFYREDCVREERKQGIKSFLLKLSLACDTASSTRRCEVLYIRAPLFD